MSYTLDFSGSEINTLLQKVDNANQPGGVAGLDENGKIDEAQLPDELNNVSQFSGMLSRSIEGMGLPKYLHPSENGYVLVADTIHPIGVAIEGAVSDTALYAVDIPFRPSGKGVLSNLTKQVLTCSLNGLIPGKLYTIIAYWYLVRPGDTTLTVVNGVSSFYANSTIENAQVYLSEGYIPVGTIWNEVNDGHYFNLQITLTVANADEHTISFGSNLCLTEYNPQLNTSQIYDPNISFEGNPVATQAQVNSLFQERMDDLESDLEEASLFTNTTLLSALGAVTQHNTSGTAHTNIRTAILDGVDEAKAFATSEAGIAANHALADMLMSIEQHNSAYDTHEDIRTAILDGVDEAKAFATVNTEGAMGVATNNAIAEAVGFIAQHDISVTAHDDIRAIAQGANTGVGASYGSVAYNADTGVLKLTRHDSQYDTVTIPLPAEYTGLETDTVTVSIGPEKAISASVKGGSISEPLLDGTLAAKVNNKQNKPEEAVVTIDTPVFPKTVYICNASGTILPGEPLHASFAIYTQDYYCFIDKETNGTALPAGVFKLALNYNDFVNAIPQYFTFGDGTYVTGNPAVTGGTLEVGTSWQRTSIIDFKTISTDRTSFEMRSAGQSDLITLASTSSGYKKIEATLSGYALLGYTAWRDNFTGNANTIIPQYNWQHYFHSDSSFSIAPTASARFGYLTATINMELVEDRIKSSVTGGAASTDNRLGNISATGTRKLSGIVTAERINKVGQSVITGSSVISLALQAYASSLTTYLNGTRIVVRGWK